MRIINIPLNTWLSIQLSTHLCTLAAIGFLALLQLLPATAQADGNHGDAPAAPAGIAAPTVTATSDAFELVGRLEGNELALMIDRAGTNEPVLGATLSVELDGRAANAPFEADHGAYALTDAALLAQLAQPGEHALVFTLIAGEESDLLIGVLDMHDMHDEAVAAPRQGSPSLPAWAAWTGVALAALAALYAVARLFRGRNRAKTLGGAA